MEFMKKILLQSFSALALVFFAATAFAEDEITSGCEADPTICETFSSPIMHDAFLFGQCKKLLDAKKQIPEGTTCTIAIKGVSGESFKYWVEKKASIKGADYWRRYQKQHIFNKSGKTEYVRFRADTSVLLRVVFDTNNNGWGDEVSNQISLVVKKK